MSEWSYIQYWGLVMNCPNLEILEFPLIEKFPPLNAGNDYSGCGISECTSLRICKMPKMNYGLLNDSGNFVFRNSFDLIHVEIGAYYNSFYLKQWNPVKALNSSSSSLVEDTDICSNNLEQFLYNFRTYIIDRVFDYSSGSKHTITLHSSVYKVVLGTDTTGYANTFHMPNEDIDYVTSLNQKLSSINWGLAYA